MKRSRIPNCYDLISQAEQREKDWDDHVAQLPRCALCSRTIYPGSKFHTAHYKPVCTNCKEELDGDTDIVEVI